MARIAKEYSTADAAFASILRNSLLMILLAMSYWLFHSSIASYYTEISRQRLLWNSLLLVSIKADEVKFGGSSELADHLGDLSIFDSPLKREIFRKDIESMLGGTRAILLEFQGFFSRDMCRVALISVAPSLPLSERKDNYFAVVPSQHCSLLPSTPLPLAIQFVQGNPAKFFVSKTTREMIQRVVQTTTLSGEGQSETCENFPDLCLTIPRLLTEASETQGTTLGWARWGQPQALVSVDTRIATSIATTLVPNKDLSGDIAQMRIVAEEGLRDRVPRNGLQFMNMTYADAAIIPSLVLVLVVPLLLLTCSAVNWINSSRDLSASAYSPLFDPVGLLAILAKFVLSSAPLLSVILVAFCFQDYYRRLILIPGTDMAFYVNPLRFHFFHVDNYEYADARGLVHDPGLAEAYFLFVSLVLLFCAILSTWILISLFRINVIEPPRLKVNAFRRTRARTLRMARNSQAYFSNRLRRKRL